MLIKLFFVHHLRGMLPKLLGLPQYSEEEEDGLRKIASNQKGADSVDRMGGIGCLRFLSGAKFGRIRRKL